MKVSRKHDNDGRFLGEILEDISQSTDPETDKKLIAGTPLGKTVKPEGEPGTHYYGTRLIYSPCTGIRSGSIRQILIDFLGSPHWINHSFEIKQPS